MSLVKVPIYPTRNLATEIDPGARTINAGTNVSFSVQPDGSITINASGGGTGTVTSVGLAAPTGFSVSGSPVTTSGTLTLAYAAGYTGYTTTEQTKLAGIAPGAQPGTVTSVGATGSTGLTVGGSPITTSGTLTFTLSANLQSWSGIAPATKANLASPVFTGDPRAPTPATADNDTSIATTAFVKNQGYATTASLGSYVLKAGDTMTGALTMKARILSDRANNEWAVLARSADAASNRGGIWVDAPGIGLYNANFNSAVRTDNDGTVSLVAGSVTRATLQAVGTFDSFYGMRVFNATQLRVYDSNNDTPIELGLGFGSGTDRNGYLWNRNNGHLSLGTNNTERIRIQPGGAVDVTGGQLAVVNNNLVVSGGDIYAYRSAGTTGVIFLRSDGSRYLFYDGSKYAMPGAGLDVGGHIWPSASASGSKKLSKISIGTAAPSGLIDGELYLRY